MNFTPPSSVSTGARRVEPTARMVACGGLMMAENSRTPYMPRLDMALAPPWYSFGINFLARARSASSRTSAEITVSDFASALRITGVISPPTSATATPISEFLKRRMRSSAHTALAARKRLTSPAPGPDDEIVERKLERRPPVLLWRRGVRLFAHRDQPAGIEIAGQIEMWDR